MAIYIMCGLLDAYVLPLLSALSRPIVDDGEGDIALWNRELAKVRDIDRALPCEHHLN
jgi:GTP cyclohydrolase I